MSVRRDARAILDRVLVDPAAARTAHLRAGLEALLQDPPAPAVFEQRLYALARDAAVLDAPAFARYALARLPARPLRRRAAARRALQRLRLATAIECDLAGYGPRAVRHLIPAVLREPRLLLRRRSLGIVARCLRRQRARNRRLLRLAVAIFRLLEARGLRACLFGSLAISLHARRFVKQHGDIDLVFGREADVRRAAARLVEELDCRIVRRCHWVGLTGERCFHIALIAPDGIPIELAYLPENPQVATRTFRVDGVALHVASLRGLRAIYALFLLAKAADAHDVEKQSKKSAIRAIDRLLAGRAGAREAAERGP